MIVSRVVSLLRDSRSQAETSNPWAGSGTCIWYLLGLITVWNIGVQRLGSGIRLLGFQILLNTYCVTLSELLNSSVPQFIYW